MDSNTNFDNTSPTDVVYFGRTDYRGVKRLFGIKRKDRRQHMYVIGKSGVGKSAMLHNLISQDIFNGEGLCVVDPHGELVEGILEMIPEHRKNDVVYFNPADLNHHVGFNPMALPDRKYKHLVASGLMAIFTKIWANVWSARMEYILNNAVLALLDTPGTTLLGIPRLLTDKEYRQNIIDNVKDPVVRAFWINEYEEWQDKYRSEAIAPLQNKVGQFLSTDIIRNVVGQSRSTIDIFDLMNDKKIFLVNVSKGRIGEDNSALLGAMLITKIQLSAMERVRIPEDEREDFYLYVDEFQNFATDSFASVLSEARKYRLNLIVAHQYIGQLETDSSDKVRDSIFGNCGTMMIFRVGAKDAEFLENEFTPEFEVQDIVNLPNYHIYLRLLVNGVTARPFSASTLPPFNPPADSVPVSEIIKNCRKLYARPRSIVEEEINKWASGSVVEGKGSEKSKDGEYFESACSVSGCQRIAKTPFKPNPDKAIYCSEHYEQVEAGQMEAVKVIVRPSESKLKKVSSELAAMGIEFKQVKEEVKSSKKGGLSLKNLKENMTREATVKPKEDVNDLKDELRNKLGAS